MTVSGITGFDHLVIIVRDIDAAAKFYETLGFQLTARGHHTRGTCNHTMMLDGNYMELVTVEHPNEGVAAYTNILARYEGAQAIGLATTDARAVHHSLQSLPYDIEPFLEFSRDVALPEGRRAASFRAARFPALANLPDLFCCEHLTRHVVWRRDWQIHANGAIGVTGIIIGHADPGHAAEAWRDLFGMPGLGAVGVEFMTRQDIARQFDGVMFPATQVDGFIAGARIGVRSVSETAAMMAKAGIEAFRTSDGAVVPRTRFTCDTLLAFCPMAAREGTG